MHNQTEYK